MDPYMDGSVKTAIFIDDQIFAVISPTGCWQNGWDFGTPSSSSPFVADIDHSQSK